MLSNPKIVVVGSLNMDIVVETDVIPMVGETVLGQQAHFIPGGKGANQAVALARLGADVQMIGAVGTDSFGKDLLDALQREGIALDGIKQEDGVATGIAIIQLCQKDNRITVVPGANHRVLPSDVDRHESLIAAADLVLLQMEIPLPTVVQAARIAKRYGKTVILNPAPAQVLPEGLLAQIDYITPNKSELDVLAGNESQGQKDLEQSIAQMFAQGAKHVITTLGANGVAFAGNDTPLTTCPCYSVEVVDTTGAGDAFNAGLAYSIATGAKLADAANFASRVAALSVTKLGAQAGMPTLEEVMTKGMCLDEKVSD
ncbi:ribokinase [Brevibacillus fluminis]|uniref:Ribokinase n=2 Tax=Brevibacillus fluminis TaxID=511487 RepID=A0A3M8DUS0_9BACL|nr:ribokinase [Brevibacillus fluminis]